MQTREIRSSRKKLLLYLAVCLAFVAGTAFLTQSPYKNDQRIWFALVLFAFGALVFAWLLIRPQRIVLDRTGFIIAGGLARSPKKILWREIEGFFIYRLPRGGKMIGFNFKPEARERSTLLKIARGFGADGALPRGWPGSPEKMVEELNEYRAQALEANRLPTSVEG